MSKNLIIFIYCLFFSLIIISFTKFYYKIIFFFKKIVYKFLNIIKKIIFFFKKYILKYILKYKKKIIFFKLFFKKNDLLEWNYKSLNYYDKSYWFIIFSPYAKIKIFLKNFNYFFKFGNKKSFYYSFIIKKNKKYLNWYLK